MVTSLLLVVLCGFSSSAQKSSIGEKFGKTLNIGVGVAGYSGYYKYVGHPLPVININYEISVARNFTLAPFISFSTFNNSYYWGDQNKNYPFRNYDYREIVIPIGVKGTYYFDELFHANSKWDFYAAGSLGFALVNSKWEKDFYGDKNYYNHASNLYMDVHIGAEYHINRLFGVYADLSTGVSTIGIAIH